MIIVIAATGINNEIGRLNELPWSIPSDLKLFQKYTKGNAVVMGRKTRQSIGRSLPNRKNYVLTGRNVEFEGAEVIRSVADILALSEKCEEEGIDLYIIGGSMLYKQTVNIADRIIINKVKSSFPDADATFPKFNKYDFMVSCEDRFGKKHEDDEYETRLYVYDRRADTYNKPNQADRIE